MFQNGTNMGKGSAAQGAERRIAARCKHVERVSLNTQWGAIAARLMDLSKTGAQVRITNGLAPFQGDDVVLRLVDGQYLSGSIVWSEGGGLGIVFAQPLSTLDDILWLEQRGPDWFHASVRAQRQ
jgi:hypothetical protein